MHLDVNGELTVKIDHGKVSWSPPERSLESVLEDVFSRRDELEAALKEERLFERNLVTLWRTRGEE